MDALSQRDAMIVAPNAGGSASAPSLPTADPAIAAAQIKSWSERAGKAEQSVTALNKRCADLEETCAPLVKDKQEIQLDLDQLKEQYASYEDDEEYLECSESEAEVSDTATEKDESDDEQPNPREDDIRPAPSVLTSQQASRTEFYELDSAERSAKSTAVLPPSSKYNIRPEPVPLAVPPTTKATTDKKQSKH